MINNTEGECSRVVEEHDAEALLGEWVKRLGLEDWLINLEVNVDVKEMENADGITYYEDTIKTAKIRIGSEGERESIERRIKYDFERILVHELLHIKFGVLDIGTPMTYEAKVTDSVMHQLIEDLAQALVLAKRGEIDRQKNLIGERVVDCGNRV